MANQESPAKIGADWIWGILLLLAVFVTYTPVWSAGYIWDDDGHLTENPCIVGPLGLKEIWTTSAADVSPLTLTTFWGEHALWGLSPLPYHLVNVLLHGACAIVLWRVLLRLQIPGAWLGAALWALHPMQVESVAWITEMKNTESGLFYLLSILFFIKWLKPEKSDQSIKASYALMFLFAAMAMASKSSTVILPLVLCLCAWKIEGRWQWRNLVAVAPVFFLSAIASAASLWTVGIHRAGTDAQLILSWPQRLAVAGDVVWFYLGKLIWPYPLMAVYPRWQIDAGHVSAYLPLALAIVVGIVLWLGRASWSRPFFFAAAYFVMALLPVLGLVNHGFLRFSFVANHFQYLAAMGPLALAGAGFYRLGEITFPARRGAQFIYGVVVCLVLAVWSWRTVWVYGSEEALWTDNLQKNPSGWEAYSRLGEGLLKQGHVDEALALFQKEVTLASGESEAHLDLADALSKKGATDEAIAEYQEALKLNPKFVEAHNGLGSMLYKKGQVDEGIAEWQKALEIKPNDTEARNNLGLGFVRKGQTDEAIAQFRKVLEINPEDAIAHYHLGLALVQKGKSDEAITQFQKALEINPQYAEAHNNLGVEFARKGRFDEAIVQFQKAVDLQPDFKVARDNLARALAAQKGPTIKQ